MILERARRAPERDRIKGRRPVLPARLGLSSLIRILETKALELENEARRASSTEQRRRRRRLAAICVDLALDLRARQPLQSI